MSKEIRLSGDHADGISAIVDDEDYPLLSRHSWHLRQNGVAKSIGDSRTTSRIFMHQLIGKVYGMPISEFGLKGVI